MKLLPLCRLRVQHERYADGICPDLAIEPTPATLQLLARYRLRLQATAGDLALWAPARADGKAPLLPLARDEVLAFELRPGDPEFSLFTDLSEFAGKTDPVYSHAAAGAAEGRLLRLSDRKRWHTEHFVVADAAAPQRLALAGAPLALNGDAGKPPRASDFSLAADVGSARITAYDAAARALTVRAAAAGQRLTLRYRARPAAGRRALAQVELLARRLPSPAAGDDAPFEIRFKARAAHWAYYLVTDQPGAFSIVDGEAASPIAFTAPGVELDGPAAQSDPFAALLAIQYPGLRRIRFVSDQPVACSNVTRRRLALRHGDQRVLEALPNAPASRPSRLGLQAAGANQDQDCFCQVIRLLKSR